MMSTKVIQIPTNVWNHVIKACILFAVCVLIGLVVHFFSPQVTLSMDYYDRLEFWIYLCLVGGVGILTCDIALTYFQIKWGGLLQAFIQAACGTIAILIPLYLLYDPVELPSLAATTLFVWIVVVLILVGASLVGMKVLKTDAYINPTRPEIAIAASEETATDKAKILARLPVYLQESELYALSAEDHYVKVHTSNGSEMVLMRLSDAIAETGVINGLQIHRSWWVARSAIDDIQTKGRSAEVTLKNKMKAPVSRNALKILRSNGWLGTVDAS